MKKAIFLFLLMFFAASAIFAVGEREKRTETEVYPDFILANGTGYTIKSIDIRPAASVYPQGDNLFSVRGLDLADRQSADIFLPEEFSNFNSFDVTIQYNSARDLR